MISIMGPDPSDIKHQNILDFLRLRKSEFVDRLGWDLTHTPEAEWDEYDLPNALFVVAYEGGKCIGGARLMRTDYKTPQRNGPELTFMLADFISGALPVGFDTSAMKSEIRPNPKIWEMTRFVGSPRVTRKILSHVNSYLADLGADSVLTISPRLMPLALKRLGYNVTVLSDPIVFDGLDYVVLKTSVQRAQQKTG